MLFPAIVSPLHTTVSTPLAVFASPAKGRSDTFVAWATALGITGCRNISAGMDELHLLGRNPESLFHKLDEARKRPPMVKLGTRTIPTRGVSCLVRIVILTDVAVRVPLQMAVSHGSTGREGRTHVMTGWSGWRHQLWVKAHHR